MIFVGMNVWSSKPVQTLRNECVRMSRLKWFCGPFIEIGVERRNGIESRIDTSKLKCKLGWICKSTKLGRAKNWSLTLQVVEAIHFSHFGTMFPSSFIWNQRRSLINDQTRSFSPLESNFTLKNPAKYNNQSNYWVKNVLIGRISWVRWSKITITIRQKLHSW